MYREEERRKKKKLLGMVFIVGTGVWIARAGSLQSHRYVGLRELDTGYGGLGVWRVWCMEGLMYGGFWCMEGLMCGGRVWRTVYGELSIRNKVSHRKSVLMIVAGLKKKGLSSPLWWRWISRNSWSARKKKKRRVYSGSWIVTNYYELDIHRRV